MALSIEDKQKRLKRKSAPEPSIPKSIILDAVQAKDFLNLNIIYCCEQCSYFSEDTGTCAIGFKVEKHVRANQDKLYNLTGKFAFCRSQEID